VSNADRRIDYKDDLTRLQNRAGQCVEELTGMVEDLSYVGPAVEQLETLAKNFVPPPEDHGYIKINANVPVENPVEELELVLRKIQLASENLARAERLLEERRRAIAELLR
jgi:hypothetical protein